jgi:hypothetical protein
LSSTFSRGVTARRLTPLIDAGASSNCYTY